MKQPSFKKCLFDASGSFLSFNKNTNKNKIVTNEVDPVYLLTTYVAGSQFYNAKLVEKFFTKGAKLSLKRQDDNLYDENAMEVLISGIKLGYIPRKNNVVLANLSRHGKQLYAEIVDFLPLDTSRGKIVCNVFMR